MLNVALEAENLNSIYIESSEHYTRILFPALVLSVGNFLDKPDVFFYRRFPRQIFNFQPLANTSSFSLRFCARTRSPAAVTGIVRTDAGADEHSTQAVYYISGKINYVF